MINETKEQIDEIKQSIKSNKDNDSQDNKFLLKSLKSEYKATFSEYNDLKQELDEIERQKLELRSRLTNL